MPDFTILDKDDDLVQKAEEKFGETDKHEYALVWNSHWMENRRKLEAEGWRLIADAKPRGLLLERKKGEDLRKSDAAFLREFADSGEMGKRTANDLRRIANRIDLLGE